MNVPAKIIDRATTPWMLTFADLLALLLTFFVLLFSMNRLEYESWRSIVDVLSEEFNPNRQATDVEERSTRVQEDQPRRQALNLNYVRSLLEDTLKNTAALDGIELYQEGAKLAIAVPDALLFQEGSDALTEGGTDRLATLANTLFILKNQLIIAGHASPQEVTAGSNFNDPWQLGLARSRIVATLLRDYGYMEPIVSTSYGDSRGLDVSSDLTDADRIRWSNRIDIVIIEERRDTSTFDL